MIWQGENAPEYFAAGRNDEGHQACSAESDLAIAQRELAAGDLQHGAFHLAHLLADHPTAPEYQALLEQYLEATSDPLVLMPPSECRDYATASLRAYFLAHTGQYEPAVELLSRALSVRANLMVVEAWLLPWLELEGVIDHLSPSTLQQALVLAMLFPNFDEIWPEEFDMLGRLLRVAEAAQQRHKLTWSAAIAQGAILRRLGRYDEALALITKLNQQQPGAVSWTALACVYRDQGRYQEARDAFVQSLQYTPDVPEILPGLSSLTAMAVHFEQWKDALYWSNETLARDPQHYYAAPAQLFCQYQLTKDEQYITQLIAHSDHPDAKGLLRRLLPYEGYLPEPDDASARNLLPSMEKLRAESLKGHMSCRASHLEPPSIPLAFRLQMHAMQMDFPFRMEPAKVPQPDPREPIEPVKYLLWRYEGVEARPALPPPGPDVSEAIARLATRRYDYEDNFAQACHMARWLGPARTAEVLAVMVYPPAIRGPHSALVWLPRVQLAAAQVIAHIDDGWEGSARREALHSVLMGPRDWTTDAAIIASVQLTQIFDPARDDVIVWLCKLLQYIPDEGSCNYHYALIFNFLKVPNLPPELREALLQHRRNSFSD